MAVREQDRRKIKPPKYKIGDRVFSYQNPTKSGKINRIRRALSLGDSHAYRLTLPVLDQDGYPRQSKWINEESLSRRKLK